MQIYLGIVGEDLDPAAVSSMLGGQPHQAARKGDPIVAKLGRGRTASRPANADYWQRVVTCDSPASSDAAVRDLFSGLAGETTTWLTLKGRFRIGITVHETPPHQTAQTIFSPSTLAFFEQRGMQIHLNED
jgi:hypothetical protein